MIVYDCRYLFLQAFLRGIMANWLVNIAIWQATASSSLPGKVGIYVHACNRHLTGWTEITESPAARGQWHSLPAIQSSSIASCESCWRAAQHRQSEASYGTRTFLVYAP